MTKLDDAFELFFQVVEGEAEGGGSAMGAGGGAFDFLPLLEEGGKFLGGEFIAGFDGGFAGHHVEDVVECGFGGLRGGGVGVEVAFGGAVEEVGEEVVGIDVSIEEEGGEGVKGQGLWADGLEFDADAIKEGLELFGQGEVSGGKVEDDGDEQALAFEFA